MLPITTFKVGLDRILLRQPVCQICVILVEVTRLEGIWKVLV